MRQAAVSLACKLMREPGAQQECPITPHLLALMVGDESEGVRRKVVREMKIDAQVSLEHLLSRARDVSARVREAAFRRLAQLELKLGDVPQKRRISLIYALLNEGEKKLHRLCTRLLLHMAYLKPQPVDIVVESGPERKRRKGAKGEKSEKSSRSTRSEASEVKHDKTEEAKGSAPGSDPMERAGELVRREGARHEDEEDEEDDEEDELEVFELEKTYALRDVVYAVMDEEHHGEHTDMRTVECLYRILKLGLDRCLPTTEVVRSQLLPLAGELFVQLPPAHTRRTVEWREGFLNGLLLVRLSLSVLGSNDNLRSQYAMLAERMIDADAFESVF